MKAISTVFAFFFTAHIAFAQIDEARDAIDRGEYVRAVNILSETLARNPVPDAYLYLGIAYTAMKEYQKAEDILKEGNQRYPKDARFPNQLADFYLTNNDREAAKAELERTLVIDPNNNYASDLLATINMSGGEVQAALQSWNKSGRPVINDILHNYYLTFGLWVVRDAVAFHPAGVLRYDEWKTTESRLLETENFANVGLEVEPTRVPDQYNAIVRTTAKRNSWSDFLFGLLKGAPVETSYVDLWNIGNSGVNVNGNYRWDTNRRRIEGRLKIPLPWPGLFHLELGDSWRETFVRSFVPTVSSTTKPTRSGFISSTYRTIAWSLAVASNIGIAPEKAAWRSCSPIAATQGGSTRRSTSGWSTGNTKTGCIWKALQQGVPWSAIPISPAV